MNTSLSAIAFIVILTAVVAFMLLMPIICENVSNRALKLCLLALLVVIPIVLITSITVSVKYVTVAGLVHRIKHGPVVVVYCKSKDKKDIDAALAKLSDTQLKRAYYYYSGKCKQCGQPYVQVVAPVMTEKQKILDRYDELTKGSTL